MQESNSYTIFYLTDATVLSLSLSIYIYVSLIGSTGVIIGLYVVLWGKAENVPELNVKSTDPKSMINPTEDVKILIKESSSVKAY